MTFVNTENPSEEASFEEAMLNGLPTLKGLWFPKNIKKLSDEFLNNIDKYSFHEIALEVLTNISTFICTREELKEIIEGAYNFPVKVNELSK